jgi:hypothetical protein
VAMPVFFRQKITAALSVAFSVFNDVPNLEQIRLNKEKLILACQQIEVIVDNLLPLTRASLLDSNLDYTEANIQSFQLLYSGSHNHAQK